MNIPSLLASSAALLLSIVGSAVGQDSPKPAPESLDIPGLPGAAPAPKKLPGSSPPVTGEGTGAGNASPAIPGLPEAAPAPKVIPAAPIVVVPEKLPPSDPGVAPTVGPKSSSTPASANELEPAQEAFVTGFLSARKAEEQDAAGDARKAAENYRAAIETLIKIKEQWPTWQPNLVEFRLKRTQESLNKLEARPIAPARTVKPEQREPKTSPGQSLIRETKLKVLQKHYESALNETIQLEKAALSAEPEERAKMEAKAKSMRDFLGKLEADLATVTPKTTAAGKPPRMVAVPELPEPIPESEIDIPGVNSRVQGAGRGPAITGAGMPGLPGKGSPGGPSPGGYLVPSARADLERIKALEKSGQAAKLDIIKAETRLKWAEASAIGDRVGAARAKRDGANRRLDLMRALRAPGTATTDTASPEAVAEAERELRAAEADLRIEKEAASSGSLGVPAAGGAPTPAKSN
jgi:hypothetical protein